MQKFKKHIIVLRFSAIGDVIIAASLTKAYAKANPDIRFTFISKPFLEPLFSGIDNLFFHGIDLTGKHKSIKGLYKLSKEIKVLEPTMITDIHSVLRTWLISALLFNTTVVRIKKGRKEKKRLTRKDNKIMSPLKSTIQRYEDVFIGAGLENINFSTQVKGIQKNNKHQSNRIGIAPFAKHKGKCWPIEYMEDVVKHFSEKENTEIYLFGGGGKEIEILDSWEKKYNNTISIAGKYSLIEELEFISSLDVLVCMDSANLHFASYAMCPAISIWGATHPHSGFYGWGQDPSDVIQTNLKCRPCSIFGNKKCQREDYACLYNIKPEMVLKKIEDKLSIKERTNLEA